MLATVSSDRHFRSLLSAASVVVIVAGLRAASGFLAPLLIAAVVVACTVPLQARLRRHGLGRGMAMAVTSLAMLLLLVAFAALIGYAGTSLVETVPRYQDRLNALVASGVAWLEARGIDASRSQLLALINPARVIGFATAMVQGLAGVVSQTLLIVMLSIFLLVETSAFSRRRDDAAGGGAAPGRWTGRLTGIAADIQQYMWITFVTGAMFAVAVWVVMTLLGVDLAPLWAILALVLSFVPGVGFILSMLPPAALALLEFGTGRTLVVVIAFVVLNNVVDNVIKPRFMKQGFDLGPFVMFASILFWAYVFGPTGALLAIPLTTTVRRLFFAPEEPAGGEVVVEATAAA